MHNNIKSGTDSNHSFFWLHSIKQHISAKLFSQTVQYTVYVGLLFLPSVKNHINFSFVAIFHDQLYDSVAISCDLT